MVNCEYCGKRHRDIVQVEKCQARAESRARRELVRSQDLDRRYRNAEREAPKVFIKRLFKAGDKIVTISNRLKKDYPETYTTYDVALLLAQDKALEGASPETMAMLLLEKEVTGDFISVPVGASSVSPEVQEKLLNRKALLEYWYENGDQILKEAKATKSPEERLAEITAQRKAEDE